VKRPLWVLFATVFWSFAIAFIVWLSLGAFHVHEPLLAMWGLLGAGLLLVRVVR
jgi:hypothetical protein